MLAHIAVSPRLTAIAKQFRAVGDPDLGLSGQSDSYGDHNGAFTEQLLKVWNHGGYRGNYAKFHAAIKAGLPASQTPNLFTLGTAARFARQQPFKV